MHSRGGSNCSPLRLRGCRCIFQHFGRFGTPDVIHTDQDPAFRNELFSELSRLSQVEHSFATAYSKEENGLVERANQEVMWHLRAMLFDARVHDKWSYLQPMVERIMNTVEKTSTGVSPAVLILNNSIRLSNRILAPGSANPTSQGVLSDTMDNWVARQHTLLQVAQAHQHQSDPRITEYPVHSYVLFTPLVGRGNKLLPKHRGAFQVMDKTDSIYIIEDLVSGKRITTHIHNLCPFIR